MKIFKTKFKDLKIIKGKNHYDIRGYFREIYKDKVIKKKLIFWCISKSKKNVIRGLHFQKKPEQDICVSVIKGKIFDVVLDLRRKSKTYGKIYTSILSESNSKSLFIPSGFAHGFCGLEKENYILYGISKYRSKKNETSIFYKDKNLKIKWPINKALVSKKDKKSLTFKKFKNLS